MEITGTFVLPDDIEIVPVVDLPMNIRDTLQYSEGDVAVTRPRSRVTTRVVDAAGAQLLESFRRPTTLVSAVIDYSSSADLDPHSVLEAAYSLVKRLLAEGLLVPEGSEAAQPIAPTLEAGSRFGRFEIQSCLQVLDDSEVYRVALPSGEPAALKRSRPSSPMRDVFEREAEILGRIGSSVAPALLESGLHEGGRYVVTEWIDGLPLVARVRQLQAMGRRARGEVAALLVRVVEAYAALHEEGVLHGDVHPENCLVERNGSVRLIDFGYGRAQDSASQVPRAGVAFFFEPELARAYRDGSPPPPASARGEQYAVAALIYFALTGSHTRRFVVERDEMLRQIVEDAPLPFWKHNLRGWDNVESTLRVALAKEPAERYPSMAAFAAVLRRAVTADTTAFESKDDEAILEEVVHQVVEDADQGGGRAELGLEHAPTASVNYGAAGIAAALLRIAQAYDDPQTLALAEAWSLRALFEADRESAFYNAEIDITPETVGETSLYHGAAGVQLVQGTIAHARGDLASAQRAVDSFADIALGASADLDLALGGSGILIGGALLEALPACTLDLSALEDRCDTLAASLWSRAEALPPIQEGARHLGMAHGWAGYLYAQLRWARAADRSIPMGLADRLDALGDLAEPAPDGLRWPWSLDGNGARYMAGWCNGSAGHVFLWTLAYQVYGEERYLQLAEGAGINAWKELGGIGNLCCGYAGRSYAALALFRRTSDEMWLQRARELALEAIHAPQLQDDESQAFGISRHSLYKGRVGLAALAADLRYPDAAGMPVFEAAG